MKLLRFLACVTLSLVSAQMYAATTTLIHSFLQSEGMSPAGPPILSEGNFYGTTGAGVSGFGNIYRLYPKKDGSYAFVNLHEFNGVDGSAPTGLIATDANGNLFGTCQSGGAVGAGTAWELVRPASLADNWTFIKLLDFGQGAGGPPRSGVVFWGGSIYGVTDSSIFTLNPDSNGNYKSAVVACCFAGAQQPVPTFDTKGNLYAIIMDGALSIFRYSPNGDGTWTGALIAPIASLSGGPEAEAGGVLMDSTGAFYGNSSAGGVHGGGTIYKVSQDSSGNWNTKVLKSFNPNTEGFQPAFSLLQVKKKYYGILLSNNGEAFQAYPSATSKQWAVNDELDTQNTALGSYYQGLTSDPTGNLYGASERGGDMTQCVAGCGAVWKIVP